MKRVIVPIALLGIGVGIALGVAHVSRAEDTQTPHRVETAASAASVTLDVEGVHCAGCTIAIRRAVEKIDGVRDVRSGESAKQLVVDYDEGKVTVARIVQAVKEAGYEARVHE